MCFRALGLAQPLLYIQHCVLCWALLQCEVRAASSRGPNTSLLVDCSISQHEFNYKPLWCGKANAVVSGPMVPLQGRNVMRLVN